MKFIFLISFCFYSRFAFAEKKVLLTPFQTNIQNCTDKKFDVLKIDSNKKLYDALDKFYALATSETLYREVVYTQKGEERKMKFEDGVIQIFTVEGEDDTFKLLSSEKFGEKKEDYQARHKVRSAEARINQLLFRAEIKTDYQKVKETRAKQVIMNITWSDGQIKSLSIEFSGEKKALSCIQKELADICNCRI